MSAIFFGSKVLILIFFWHTIEYAPFFFSPKEKWQKRKLPQNSYQDKFSIYSLKVQSSLRYDTNFFNVRKFQFVTCYFVNAGIF
jgi:hypothetical protein